MDRRVAFIGVVLLVLGAIFIGLSRISEAEERWSHGDGSYSSYMDEESHGIFFEKDDKWDVEGMSYVYVEFGQHIEQPTDNLTFSLYDFNHVKVASVLYGELQQMPHGLPVPRSGWYIIKLENVISGYTASGEYVRFVLVSATLFPYQLLLSVGIPLALVGVGIAIYGARATRSMPKSARSKPFKRVRAVSFAAASNTMSQLS